jgi:UDP-N-acetylmuramate--alanine ligase
VRPSGAPLAVTVNLPGQHNVLNSLAAIAVAIEVGVEDAAIQRALASFQGVERRMQHVADVQTSVGCVTIVDDYGHHPTEVAATLEALRQGYPNRRLVLAFQPHRYSRTHDLIDDFGKVLSTVDVLLVTEVYAAGEAPIPGADGRAICRAIRGRGLVEPLFVDKVEELAESLKDVIRDGDVIVSMGAGNISAVAHGLPERFAELLPPRGNA